MIIYKQIGKAGSSHWLTSLIRLSVVQVCLLGTLSCGQSSTSPESILGEETPVDDLNPAPEDNVGKIPVGVSFKMQTLRRVDETTFGDNWCVTWSADGNQMTSMSDGSWEPDWFTNGTWC